jgi:hypothetical protein
MTARPQSKLFAHSNWSLATTTGLESRRSWTDVEAASPETGEAALPGTALVEVNWIGRRPFWLIDPFVRPDDLPANCCNDSTLSSAATRIVGRHDSPRLLSGRRTIRQTTRIVVLLRSFPPRSDLSVTSFEDPLLFNWRSSRRLAGPGAMVARRRDIRFGWLPWFACRWRGCCPCSCSGPTRGSGC